MSQTMGIDYFGIETDIKDDDKVFALKHRYATRGGGYDAGAAYAAFGRFVELLADIYREGFVIEMTAQRRARLCLQMGLSEDEFDEFVGACVDVGLFDRELFEEQGVLTSKGIQRRYYIVASRRRGKIPEDQARYLLIDGVPGAKKADADNVQQVEATHSMSETTCDMLQQDCNNMQQHVATLQQHATCCPTREEKRREVKERKGKKKRREGEDPVAKVARSLTTPLGERGKRQTQPYPLSCFSIPSEGRLYDDGCGSERESAWEALTARLRARAPDCHIEAVAEKVCSTCPPDCPETPECVSQCYELVCGALDKFDRAKCASPVPLIAKVLEEDRRAVG